jgi:hypothetical protein
VRLLALILGLAGMQQDGAVDLQVPGTFQHGAWQGRCFRDGFLSGMDHELCRGWTSGPVAIHFERTAEAMHITVEVSGCSASNQVTMLPESTLASADRNRTVAAVLRMVVRDAVKACRSGLKAPGVDLRTLAAVLTETDGLEAGSMR